DSGEINTEVSDPAGAVEAMAAEVEAAGGELGTVDRLDGLTVDRGDWWYNVRPSNTEPLLRLNVEAPDDESLARHVEEIRTAVARLAGG
ncbi:MAG: phosphomannomutase/phosphoglucomutase, partial [Acidimicrobiales bacterium]